MNEARAHLVLGAAGGIGTALCRRLADRGDRILLAGRSEGPLAELAADLDLPHQLLDATRPDDVEAAAALAVDTFGRLDGVVNLVGSILLKPAHLISPEDWESTLSQNLGSAFAPVRAGAKALRKAGGSIVLMSTAAARLGLPNHEAITAAKAGVEGLTRSAAATYAARGIRVNCVAPGLVRTPLSARITENEVLAEASRSMHALGRLGEPDDIASAIAWLLGPEQTWITGQVIGVDGGLGSVRARGG